MCTQITTTIHSLFHQRLHKNRQEVVRIIILPTMTQCSLELAQDVSGSLHGEDDEPELQHLIGDGNLNFDQCRDETHEPYLARNVVHEAEKLST